MKKQTLKDIAVVKSGCPSSKLNTNKEKNGIEIKVINIRDLDITEPILNCEKIESTWMTDTESIEKYKLSYGQVLITAKGQSIRAQAFTESAIPALPHTNLLVITGIKDYVLPEYLALYLSLEPVVEELRESLSGTTIWSLSKKDLDKVEIVLPEIALQKKLVQLSRAGKLLMQARKKEIENVSLLLNQTLVSQIMGGSN
jgi:restriction endonuclease S subunit